MPLTFIWEDTKRISGNILKLIATWNTEIIMKGVCINFCYHVTNYQDLMA